jgi:hypothetical protein
MKRALSIYYGVLVEASDCDRGDYERRALTCPLCNAGVFWASGEHQSPHFRHYPGEGRADCEERAAKMSPEAWQQKEKVLEQQLYRKLSGRFWKIYSTIYSTMNLGQIEADLAKYSADEGVVSVHAMDLLQVFIDKTRQRADDIDLLIEALADTLKAGDFTIQGGYDDMAQALSLSARQNSHVTSVKVAFHFLINRRNQQMLEILGFYCMADYMLYAQKDPVGFPLPGPQNLHLYYAWVLNDLIGTLICVPWAAAAKVLEQGDQNQIPESMLVKTRPRPNGLRAILTMSAATQNLYR